MKFDYNDINLIPKKCAVESRSECDTRMFTTAISYGDGNSLEVFDYVQWK